MALVTAFLDANVLYPSGLRNLLMRLAVADAFKARWSYQVHTEWITAVLRNHPDLGPERMERTRALMDAHVRDALVHGFESQIDDLSLPDPDDRHVLAAAIHCKADIIVTRNLKDFPKTTLSPFNIEPVAPDPFIMRLFHHSSEIVIAAASEHRQSLQRPSKTVDEYLASLERHSLTHTVAALRNHAGQL